MSRRRVVMAEFDSLVLDGFGELLRASQTGDVGLWIGAVPDVGAPTPVQNVAEQLLLDGSIVSGSRSDNATLSFTVVCPIGDAARRAAVLSAFVAAVNRASFTLTWTPAGPQALPVVLDCFRAAVGSPTFLGARSTSGVMLAVTVPRFPFTRTSTPVTLTADSASVVLDSFDSVAGVGADPLVTLSESTNCVEGSGALAARITETVNTTAGDGLLIADVTLGAPVDLAGLSLLSMYVNVTPDTPPAGSYKTVACSLRVRLFDGAGRSNSFQIRSEFVTYATWTRMLAELDEPIDSYSVTVDLGDVTRFTVSRSTRIDAQVDVSFGPGVVLLDSFAAVNDAQVVGSSQASVLMQNPAGSFRAPVTLDVTFDSNVGGLLIAHTPDPSPGYDPVIPSATLPARAYRGTHLVVVDGLTGPTELQPWTITVTATQGGQSQSVSRTWSSGALANGAPAMAVIGPLTLPVSEIADDNVSTTFTLAVDAGTGTVGQVLLCSLADDDSTVILADDVNSDSFTVESASPQGVAGRVFAAGVGVNAYGAGSIHFTPGDNHITCYGAGGVPGHAVASFYPRFLFERPPIKGIDG